jgi:hypothetical protein
MLKKKAFSSIFVELLLHARIGAVLLVSLFLLSCNNLRNLAPVSSGVNQNLSNPNGGDGSSYTITGVYDSQQSPGALFDVITTDSQFDVFCTGSYSPCVCEVKYDSPGIGEVINQGAVIYQESNLIRCQNVVQGGIGSFELKVLSTGTGNYSNSITINMSSGGFVNTTYADLSLEDNYIDVKRFQCRKREFIPNPFSPNIVDPIQSEDPKLIYPFNYYTTNVSNSLWALQSSGTQNWECTLNPNATNTLQWWANPVVFSAAACPGSNSFCSTEGELIYRRNTLEGGKVKASPTSTAKGKKRSSFSLSKIQYGVFNVPVRAAVGPSNVSGAGSYETSTFDVIGYASRSIPSVGGTSGCPTNVTIPSNAHWVKLWNFRANNITPPQYVVSSPAMNASGIACNPMPTSTGSPQKVFPSCYMTELNTATVNSEWKSVSLYNAILPSTSSLTASSNTSVAFDPPYIWWATTTNSLTSRVGFLTSNNGIHACYNITRMSDGGIQGKPVELWHPSPFAETMSVDGMKNLPWNIYNAYNASLNPAAVPLYLTQACVDGYRWLQTNSSNAACNAPVKDNFKLVQSEPFDNLGSNDLQKFTNNNYSDHLFVVTDTSVNDSAVINSVQAEYIPVTYRTKSDCNPTSDGSTQVSLGCNSAKKISWGVTVQDIDNPTGPIVYPLCVLQFEQ